MLIKGVLTIHIKRVYAYSGILLQLARHFGVRHSMYTPSLSRYSASFRGMPMPLITAAWAYMFGMHHGSRAVWVYR